MNNPEIPQECRDIREQLSSYLDEELAPAQSVVITRHLEACPACRQEFQRWQEVWDLLLLPPETAPAGLDRRILERLEPRPHSRWFNLALTASFLIGVFLGGQLGLNLYEGQNLVQATPESALEEVLADVPAGSLSSLWLADSGDNNHD